MEIILHAHHADVPETLRAEAEAAVRRVAARLHRVVDAIVRFVGDGQTRRVEIVLRGAQHRDLFAQADAHAFAPALSAAVHRLDAQVRKYHARRPSAGGARTG